ncbi:MAG: DNA alkylation repair protein [Clostridia bacterium]|nr:DNA alkylation repair protein [Clostridia bacterium]
MTNKEIRRKIEELADEKYKEFHTGLCPNSNEIIGVRVPVLRNFAKDIVKSENIEKYLENALDNSYEEILLQGMVLGLWKTDIQNFCTYLEKFIPKINSWAVCDVSVAGFKITKKNMEYMWQFLQKYLKSDKEFELRFAIVMMLDFYIIEEYIDKVLEILNNVKHEGYYVKMAIAWTIQVAFVKFPEKTFELLKNNKIDDWTYNKALQKIIESYRVDEETKKIIRNMKRI